jgi:hypothetical protein
MAYNQTVTPIVTAVQFRVNYPEFADKTKYQDATINYWLVVATLMLNPNRWGNLLQLATELFVAHEIVLETQAIQAGQAGGWPGISRGAINSETPGEVSVSYETVATLEEGGGNWNLTVYGTRLYRWIRMAGAGPIQVGPGCGGGAGTVPGSNDGSGVAWPGPNCLPGWFGS